MAVKEVQKAPVKGIETFSGKQIHGKALAGGHVSALRNDKVEVTSRPPSTIMQLKNDVRSKANSIISVANVASEATNEIEKLVKSIGGIVEQVQSGDVPEQRRTVLEGEANSLLNEIKKRAQTKAEGLRPLAGDPVRLDVEDQLGKTLELILPDDAKEAFGMGAVQFSTKDAILGTIASIEVAKVRLKELRGKVDDGLKALKGTVAELEVALQNSEASQSSVRDLESALKLAGNTRADITANPSSAIGSFGNLNSKSLDLLDG